MSKNYETQNFSLEEETRIAVIKRLVKDLNDLLAISPLTRAGEWEIHPGRAVRDLSVDIATGLTSQTQIRVSPRAIDWIEELSASPESMSPTNSLFRDTYTILLVGSAADPTVGGVDFRRKREVIDSDQLCLGEHVENTTYHLHPDVLATRSNHIFAAAQKPSYTLNQFSEKLQVLYDTIKQAHENS